MSGKQLTLKEVVKIYFLIDFENVRSKGLEGAEYLLPTDHVIIFYSKDAPDAVGHYLQAIKYSHCSFEIVKLLHKSKNGLDFYIASKVGELRGSGVNERIAIVSRDAGYTAVKDYINDRYPKAKKIILGITIQNSIIQECGHDERSVLTKYGASNVSFETFQNELEIERSGKIDIFESLKGTKHINNGHTVQQIVDADNHKVPVYRKLVHEFGQKDGLDIYRRIKDQLLTKDDR